MRVLSLVQWHHFAFLIISIALLGFGSSGTLLVIFRKKLFNNFEFSFTTCLALASTFIIISPKLLQFIKFEPYLLIWNIEEFWSILFVTFLIFIPFLFGACAIGLALMNYPEVVNKIYFVNLLGSAIGMISTVGLLFLIHPFQLISIISIFSFVATIFSAIAFFAKNFYLKKFKRYVIGLLLLGTFVITFLSLSLFPIKLNSSEYKSLSKTLLLPDAKIIYEKVSPLGVLNVVKSDFLRYASSLSLAYTDEIPTQLGVFIDGEWNGTIIKQNEDQNLEFLNYTTSTLPYQLYIKPDVLVIGAGTGTEVQIAFQCGAEKVTGIELNPQIIKMIRENFAAETQNIYNRKNIKIENAEARAFLKQTQQKFDIITIPILEGFTASAAGVHSLYENYLFTIESLSLMFDRLNENGILAISTWINHPPRNAMKLIAMMTEMIKQKGIENPENHFAGTRSWGATTLIISKNGFSNEHIQKIKQFCEKYYFDPVYFPSISELDINKYNQLEYDFFYYAAKSIFEGKSDSLYKNYPFFIEPATDNQPYFSHFLKLKNIPTFLKLIGKDSIPFMDFGYITLITTLLIVLLLSIIFILLPLFKTFKNATSKNRIMWTFFYFSAIGIGFMFIEITLIQKFILFLGHPTYSISAVITGLLFFSGLGSLYSYRINIIKNLRLIVSLIIIILILYNLFLNFFFENLIYYPVLIKYIVSIILISPLAFFMGMPFPAGLKFLSNANPSLIPWAWGINGCLSVCATTLATFIAMEFGFKIVLFLAMISYGILIIIGYLKDNSS